MKATVMMEKEIDVKYVRACMAVRYDDEDIPYDFPLRKGDIWQGDIDVDTGVIQDWPEGKEGVLQMKVCDQGSYALLDDEKNEIASIENDYVPNELIPGEYGDIVNLDIGTDGTVKNWPTSPCLDDFFPSAA